MGAHLKNRSERKIFLGYQGSRGILERHPDELRKLRRLFSQGDRTLSLRNFLIHRHILS
jgi:hypothetical protein